MKDRSVTRILQLYPKPGSTASKEGIYADLELPPRASGRARRSIRRPYVIVNMVSSVDGKAQVAGSAAGIGSALDRAVMRTLRAKADAVMVGAGTLRAERLTLGLDETGLRQPMGIIVSSGAENLPMEHLLSLRDQNVVLLTGRELRDAPDAGIEVLRAPTLPSGDLDLSGALELLKENRDIGVLLVEGGPSLNHALFSRGLVDELFLTVAPKLLGGKTGETSTILEGEEGGLLPSDLRLLSAFAAGGELFLRYAVAG